MSVTPSGSFSLPASKLRRMVSLSATFQAATRAANAAQALGKVYFKNVAGTEERPYAVIRPGDQHTYDLVAGGDQNQLRPSGGLILFLCLDTNPLYYADNVSAAFEAANFAGGVIDDLAAIAGGDDTGAADGTGHLSITRLNLVEFCENPEDDWVSLGRFYLAVYQIAWGDVG